jgi:hypothetical protein
MFEHILSTYNLTFNNNTSTLVLENGNINLSFIFGAFILILTGIVMIYDIHKSNQRLKNK